MLLFLCGILFVGFGAFQLGQYNKALLYHADAVRVYNNNLAMLQGTFQYLELKEAKTPIQASLKTTLLSQLNDLKFSTEVFEFAAENQKLSKESMEALSCYQRVLQQSIEETEIFLSTEGIDFTEIESLLFLENQFQERSYFKENDLKMNHLIKQYKENAFK